MPDAPVARSYPKPPITEAVVEVRTDEPLDSRDLDRCRDRFKRRYGKIELQNEILVNVSDTGVSHEAKRVGYKLTAANAVDLMLLYPTVLGTVRLAPYLGFDALLADVKDNYDTFVKVVGRRRVTRLGVRTINRIDVPNVPFERAGQWSAFVHARPAIPQEVATEPGGYYMNVQTAYSGNRDIKITLQSGPVTQVLLDYQSLQLDIDVAIDANIPQRLDEMWECLSVLRSAKKRDF